MSVDFRLPDLGEGIHEAQVISVAVKEGDSVREDQALMEVETDKAAVEIPSPQTGVIEKVHVQAGQTLHVGDVLVTFGGDGEAKSATDEEEAATEKKKAATEQKEKPAKRRTAAEQPSPAAAPPSAEKPEAVPAAASAAPTATAATPARRDGPVPASPAVRRLARERGVDLHQVRGSGPGGRVTREDLEQHLTGVKGEAEDRAAPTTPAGQPSLAAPATAATVPGEIEPHGVTDVDKWGPIVRQQLTQIRKTIAAQMVRSYTQIPHVVHAEQIDVTELDAFRKEARQSGLPGAEKLTLTPFIVKALVNSLKRFPKFNSSFDPEQNELIFKRYYSVGMAVDTPRGLVVPVVRHVDTKSVLQLAVEYAALAERTRQGKFAIEQLRGGTFTITNVGALGGVFFTPIINHPEVAILGVGRVGPTTVVRDGQIVIRTVMPVCLSFDHRVCDGAEAARFVNDIQAQLENPLRLTL